MNTEQEKSVNLSVEEEYAKKFIPQVHRVARITHIVGILLMFSCPFYLYFICGYRDVPVSSYISYMAIFTPMLIGNWISSPVSYWPMLGSAAGYTAYLAGNGNNMKVPVAVACTSQLGVDVLSPKGQVIVILGVTVSTFVNYVILFIIVFFGQMILSVLPAPVVSAFSYLLSALFAYLLCTQFSMAGKGNAAKGIASQWYVIVAALVGYYGFNMLPIFAPVKSYAMLLNLVLCCVVVYIKYRFDKRKKPETE